jgi:hypothetical protein
MKEKITIVCDDFNHVLVIVDYLYRKKIIKKIYQLNDKFAPYYGIIEVTIDKSGLRKILDSKFKNNYLLR